MTGNCMFCFLGFNDCLILLSLNGDYYGYIKGSLILEEVLESEDKYFKGS